MKRILYIIIGVMCLGCSHKEQSSQAMEDTIYVAPDSVWDTTECYAHIDSVDRELKTYSYEVYGDSNMMDRIVTEGLPDSLQRTGDTPHKDTLWMLKENTAYHKMPIEKKEDGVCQ